MKQPNKARRRGPADSRGTLKRLLGYLLQYKLRFAVVLVCILISACTTVAGSLFLKTLIDDYITPLLASGSTDFSGLLRALTGMACLYLVGILSAWSFNRLMVDISQGVLKTVRDQMFSHMQTLPIQYFDTHHHGDVMSLYTNDVDTLRQMISQSLPQMFSSLVSVIAVFFAMLFTNVPLTALVILCVFCMLNVTKYVAGKSGQHFVAQQRDLGALNGYIEEMIGGQKVIKVFCHEDQAKTGFDTLNERLFHSADQANKYANILMPIMMNLGNLQYVLVAMVGGVLALSGWGVTLGTIASFLQL